MKICIVLLLTLFFHIQACIAQPVLDTSYQTYVTVHWEFGTNAITFYRLRPFEGRNLTWVLNINWAAPILDSYRVIVRCGYLRGARWYPSSYAYSIPAQMILTSGGPKDYLYNSDYRGLEDAGWGIFQYSESIVGKNIFPRNLPFDSTLKSLRTTNRRAGGSPSLYTGTNSIKYVGYGTLILNGDSIVNTVVMKNSDVFYFYIPGQTLPIISAASTGVIIKVLIGEGPMTEVNAIKGIPLTISPNPVSEILTIIGNNKQDNTIAIKDISGKTSFLEIFNENKINVSQLPKGIYTLLAGSQSIRFVKE